jgi:hypothetical protein
MYKSTSRFRQGLANKGKKLTGRNLVASDSLSLSAKPLRTGLPKRLDKEAETATAAAKARYETIEVRSPRLVKRRDPN